MKKLAIALGVLVLLAGAMGYNVWRANHEPVNSAPDPLQTGRIKLHSQLEQSKQLEAQVEKQNWNSAPQLRALVKAHEHRIEQLTGNSQANEILAYDHDSLDRLQKRITYLEEQEAEQPEEPQETPAPAPAATKAP